MSDRPMHTVPGAFEKLTALYAEGEALVDNGQFEEAIAKFGEGIAIDDHFRQRYITMYAQRGFAHQRLGNFEPAIADYTKAIEMEPEINQAQYHFHRGMCWSALSDPERAVEDYTASMQLFPDHPGPYHLRGKLYVDMERYEDAIADFDELMNRKPHPEGYALRGLCKLTLGDAAGAVLDVEQSSEMRPDPYNDYLLACAHAALGDDAKVLHYVETTLAAAPDYKQSFAEDSDFAAYRDKPAFSALLARH